MGTGTEDMTRRCREAGVAGPEFAVTDGFVDHDPAAVQKGLSSGHPGSHAPEVTPEVARPVVALEDDLSSLQKCLREVAG